MPHDIKLDCFTIKVRGRHSRNNRAEYVRLTDLTYVDGEQQRHILNFKDFFEYFVRGFNRSFAGITGNETVIYPTLSEMSFASERNLIYGFLKGGKYGLGRTIIDRNNPEDEVFHVEIDHVDSIDYFFMLWVPTDSNIGLIIVQGLSTSSISDTFVRLIKKYFTDNIEDKLIEIDKFVPKDTVKQMKEDGEINKIILRKQHLPPDLANSILGTEFIDSPVVIEVKISGLRGVSNNLKAIVEGRFSDAIRDFVAGEPRFFTTPILEQVGMDGTHDVLLEYEFNGKKATAKKSQGFQLQPYYYVHEESIERDPSTNLPTRESISAYVLDFLNMILDEILPNRQNVQD